MSHAPHPATTVAGFGDKTDEPGPERATSTRPHRAVSATMGSPSMEVLHTTVAGAPGTAVSGEVDVATGPALTDRLEQAIRRTAGPFVLDLCAVTFFDSTGVHALLRTSALLGREDRQLLLVCPPGHVRRVLELMGILEMFVLYDSQEDAAAAFTRVEA